MSKVIFFIVTHKLQPIVNLRQVTRVIALALTTLSTLTTSAIEAAPDTLCVKCVDGTTRNITLVGDEFYNYYTTLDGQRIEPVDATMSLWQISQGPSRSKIKAARSAAKKRLGTPRRSASMDANEFKGLVLLIEFSDKKFMRDDAIEIFENMFNERNYKGFYNRADPPALIEYTGSVRDYFYDNSMGIFDPTFDIYGPIEIEMKQVDPQQTINARELIAQSLNNAAKTVDFSKYDCDDDGVVDLVYFIFAGGGSNQPGNNPYFVWPHAGLAQNHEFNGVKIGNYACSVELYGRESYQAIDGIGTICHEFSHVLGLPDLYDTDYQNSGGQSVHPDGWSIMAGGTYSNYARTPAGYSGYERYAAGFAEPILIEYPCLNTITSLASSNRFFKVNSDNPDEFFIIENRKTEKWDRYLPGTGMLVWRVDSTDVEVWEKNLVNCNPDRTYLNVQRADPQRSMTTGEIIDSGYDTYPGKGNVVSAQLLDHNGIPAPVEFMNIAQDRYSYVVSFVAVNTKLPKLTESFDALSSTGTNSYKGDFTDWALTNASVVDNGDDGMSVKMVRGSIVTSADIERRIYSLSFDYINPTTTATVKCEYSTNRGITWKSLQELSGTDTYVVPSGERHSITFIVPGIENARYRITQSAGHRTNGCFLDNIALQHDKKNETSSVDDIAVSGSSSLNASISGNIITVTGTPLQPVTMHGLDGTLLQQRVCDSEGHCTLHCPRSGIVIISQVGSHIKLLCR